MEQESTAPARWRPSWCRGRRRRHEPVAAYRTPRPLPTAPAGEPPAAASDPRARHPWDRTVIRSSSSSTSAAQKRRGVQQPARGATSKRERLASSVAACRRAVEARHRLVQARPLAGRPIAARRGHRWLRTWVRGVGNLLADRARAALRQRRGDCVAQRRRVERKPARSNYVGAVWTYTRLRDTRAVGGSGPDCRSGTRAGCSGSTHRTRCCPTPRS